MRRQYPQPVIRNINRVESIMTEVEALFHATVAVLLSCVAYHFSSGLRRYGSWGLGLMVAGCLIPLLDYVIFYINAHDRVDLLTQSPIFYGLYYGLVLIGSIAVLTVFLASLPGHRFRDPYFRGLRPAARGLPPANFSRASGAAAVT